MKTLAAILVETRRPIVISEIEIPTLKTGQVLVKIAFSGVCHTQILECRGYRGEDLFLPHCLGHEGTGIVSEIGSGVTKVKVGDKVILSWIKGSGINVGGSIYSWNEKNVNAGAITTFAHYSVISENRLTVITEEIPMDEAAMLGCAVPTGVGAVFNIARPKPGQSMAVFGSGGIGLCAIAGAKIVGCYPIVAIDINEEKLKLAKEFGATHTINSKNMNPVKAISGFCKGGVDFAIESSGRPEVMSQAIDAVHPQGGTAIIVGNARHGEQLELDPKQFNLGKRLLGVGGSESCPDVDFPRYCKLIKSGNFNIKPMLSKVYGLNDINEAMNDLEAGRVIRPLIDMSKV